MRTTRVEPLSLIEGEALGELEGAGRWVLTSDGAITTVRYDWKVRTILEGVGIENKEAAVDEDGDIVIARTFGRREQTTDYHGHLRIVLYKSGNSRVDLRYHADSVDMKNEEPPFVEDCSQWLAQFFKKEVEGRINAAYMFDESFTTTIALPFPLATSEKALAGASVTGVSIQFPQSERLSIVQRGLKEIYITSFSPEKICLANFELSNQLQQLTGSINSLIRKQDAPSNENSSQEK